MAGGAGGVNCLFCQIGRSSTSTSLLHTDDKVVAFQDIKPSAFRHYLVIPVDHISTVKDLQRTAEDYSLVSHMLTVGQSLLRRDAPESMQYRFGFHRPPLNSVNHLHLHCLALPFSPRWVDGVVYQPQRANLLHVSIWRPILILNQRVMLCNGVAIVILQFALRENYGTYYLTVVGKKPLLFTEL